MQFGEGLQIYVEQDWASNHINVWALETRGYKQYSITHNSEGRLESTEIPECTSPNADGAKPLLRLPRMFADTLFKALAENLSERGVKTENDHALKGQLTAQTKHLEDMQMIVKKLMKL